SGLTVGLVPGLEDAFYVQVYAAVAIAFVAAAIVLVAATKGRLGYRARGMPVFAGAEPRRGAQ
ncbi:MAG TPA: hypothetical protein VGV91_01515, partial [Rubrobacter sp.]|nr:hypothetical protein [Rubrobacter sp.]